MRSSVKTFSAFCGVLVAGLSIAQAAVAEDTSVPVWPGDAEHPFWNAYSEWFMYAPAFPFQAVSGAVRYRFEVSGGDGRTVTFASDRPTAALSPVWGQLPGGYVNVVCRGVDAQDKVVADAGSRRFWKKAPFVAGSYPAAVRSHADAAARALTYFLLEPSLAYLEKNGVPDPAYSLNGYPSKILSAEIETLVRVADRLPDLRTRVLSLARKAADHLIAGRLAAGTPLEYFTLTYEGEGEYGRSRENAGRNMLVYPADAGSALLALHVCAQEPKYLDAAEKIAQTYLRLQGEDGTWPLLVDEKTGQPLKPNRLIPTTVIRFLEKLHAVTGKAAYRTAADRAFAFIEQGPMKTRAWDAQFEDTAIRATYENLSKEEACATALFMLERFPGDATRRQQAREILRWAEDQFVWWEVPYGQPRPDDGTFGTWGGGTWILPGVQEQRGLWSPIDGSAATLIRTFLALYRADGDERDLQKAKALGDSITRAQWEDGCIRTFWVLAPRTDDRYHVWLNCHLSTLSALEELVGVCSQKKKKEMTK